MKRILFLVISLFALMGASDPYGTALREPRRLKAAKQYEQASQAYEAAIASGLCGSVRRDALFELAECYQETHLWDQAIQVYQEFLATLRPVRDDDADLVRGQGKLAECFFRIGEYRQALEAVRATRGHSLNSLCGTCDAEYRYQQTMREAVLHEYVREYEAAVSGYLGAASYDHPWDYLRLLTLYDAAGQLPDLLRLVDYEDHIYAEMTKGYRQKCVHGGYCPPEHSSLCRTIQGMLKIRDLEEAGDWPALLSILEPGLSDGDGSRPDYELREAARLLALHPAETLPLLLPNAPKHGYYTYALGLTGAPSAVAALQEEAKKEKNYGRVFGLVDDLLAAGPAGVAALNGLYPDAHPNLKLLIERYHQGTLNDFRNVPQGGFESFPFPSIPEHIQLPNRCTYQGPPVNEFECVRGQVMTDAGERGESHP